MSLLSVRRSGRGGRGLPPPVAFNLETALSDAVTSANAAPGTTADVNIPAGTLLLLSTASKPRVSASGSKVRLIGAGISATRIAGAPGFDPAARLLNPNSLTLDKDPWDVASPVLVASVARGALTLTRTGGAAASTGYYHLADDAVQYDGTTKFNTALVKVTVVNGATLTLDEACPIDASVGVVALYPTGPSVCEGFELHNLTVDGYVDGSYLNVPIYGYYLNHVGLYNVRFTRFSRAAIQVFRSRHVRTSNFQADTMEPAFHETVGKGAGLDLYASHDIIGAGFTFDNLRHGIELSMCQDGQFDNGTIANSWGNSIDAHGQRSVNCSFDNWTSDPEPGLSAPSLYAVRFGNESFKDWETGHSLSNADLGGTDILCCGARDCTFDNITGVRRIRLEGNTDADLGGDIYPQSVVFTNGHSQADATGYNFYGPSGGFKRFTGIQVWDWLFEGHTAGTVANWEFDTIDGSSDILFDGCWFDNSLNSATKAILAHAAAAPSGTLTVTIRNSIFNLNALSDAFAQSQTNSPTIILHLIDNVQCKTGDVSFSAPASAGNYTLATNTGNKVVQAVEPVPASVAAMIVRRDAIIASVQE